MKNWLNNYFAFTKREYNGLLVIMAILLAVSLLPYVYSSFFLKTRNATVEEQAALQELVLTHEQPLKNYTGKPQQKASRWQGHQVSLFVFDPNLIDLSQWQQLGLSIKQAQAIINYRNKGGKFYKAADLQKMYTISPQKYQELAPYIQIISQQESKKNVKALGALPEKRPLVIVELNGADTLQLDEISGVGPAFARRIVKYRERLGGFYQKEQLMEVYGLDSAKFKEIKDQVKIDQRQIRKLNINTVGFEELKNHPYLKFKQINALIQYRKQHGKYNSVEDLKKVIILDPQTIERLAPYLQF